MKNKLHLKLYNFKRVGTKALRIEVKKAARKWNKPMTIYMIDMDSFISSHFCEKLLAEMPHKVLALDVYNDKIV